jgi:hypothetical protein
VQAGLGAAQAPDCGVRARRGQLRPPSATGWGRGGRLGELVLGGQAGLVGLGQLDLVLSGEQGVAADLVQVQAEQVRLQGPRLVRMLRMLVICETSLAPPMEIRRPALPTADRPSHPSAWTLHIQPRTVEALSHMAFPGPLLTILSTPVGVRPLGRGCA